MKPVALALIFAASPVLADVVVVDGDSLRIDGVSIRLHGIDAPEYRQRCTDGFPAGAVAFDVLRNLIAGKAVMCESRNTDRYGRTIAVCRADGLDLGAMMVRSGWAWAFGDQRYGERAKAAAEGVFGREFQTLVNVANVSRKFESNRRRLDLSWSHHAEVAALPPEEADALLDEAEDNGWSKRELRQAVNQAQRLKSAPRQGQRAKARGLASSGDRSLGYGAAAWLAHDSAGSPYLATGRDSASEWPAGGSKGAACVWRAAAPAQYASPDSGRGDLDE